MAKWEVLSRLWSISQKRYFEIGDKIELDDESASVLLKKKCIKPASFVRRKSNKELKNDTNH